MRIGIHLTNRPALSEPALGPWLRELAARAEEAGLDSIWAMDQATVPANLAGAGGALPEAYATLATLAAASETIELGALVSNLPRREPQLLIQALATPEALSGGRAWLGLGASGAAGLDYEGLEAFLDRFRDSPAGAAARVLVAGAGERRTLPLVARRADACNLLERIGIADIERRLALLDRLCEEAGRDPAELTKTTFGPLGDLDPGALEERFEKLAATGVDLALVDLGEAPLGEVLPLLGEIQARLGPGAAANPGS